MAPDREALSKEGLEAVKVRWGTWLSSLAVVMVVAGGCGNDAPEAPEPTVATTTAAETTVASSDVAETTTTVAGQTGLLGDDLNQDGQPDPTCSTKDFGGGLVLVVPCESATYASEPSEGVTLVPGSLYSLPAIPDDLKEKVLTDVSANAVRARDPNGKQVVVFFIQSDTLFAVGSSALSEPARATLDGLSRNLKAQWPTAPVQVRGHTDATGTASANQALSEQRASTVAGYLAGRGFDRSSLTSIGLGPTQPVALEKNPDGSESPAGRRENRRVELVVRIP